MRNRNFTLAVASSLLVIGGCSESGDPGTGTGTSLGTPLASPTAPTAPVTPPTTGPADTTSWTANATVDSVAAGTTSPCGWGTSRGDVRIGVTWRVIQTAGAITLDEDMHNWPTDDIPYSGQLDGAQFAASYSQGSDYANYVCQFRESALSGSFTSDSTFVAVETLVWGVPGKETTVVRHWKGSRM